MFKKIFFNKKGFTLLELMIVIGMAVLIMAASSAFFKKGDKNAIDVVSAQVLTDVRYARNLAVSHTVFDFANTKCGNYDCPSDVTGLGKIYPPGGYGIYIKQATEADPTAIPQIKAADAAYIIFADSDIDGADSDTSPIGYDIDKDIIITTYTISSMSIYDAGNPEMTDNYLTFKSENEILTDLATTGGGKYQIVLDTEPVYPAIGYKGIISLGERLADGSIVMSLGTSAGEYQSTCQAAGDLCPTGICCPGVSCIAGICTYGSVPDDGKSCFPAGTKILMADYSSKNIEDLKVGDYVVSYDEDLKVAVSSEILELYTPVRNHMCKITFLDSSLKLTNEHPIYTKDGWKSINPVASEQEIKGLVVGALALGDQVFFSGGNYKEIMDINCWPEVIQTYTLKSVKDYNTFFADNVLVHNAVGCIRPPIGGGV